MPLFQNEVIEGNCIEVMSEQLEKESVDLMFCDPPYNLQLRQSLSRPDSSQVAAVTDAWDRFDSLDSYTQFTLDWLQAAKRVLKPTGTLWVSGTYHNIYSIGHVLQTFGWNYLGDIIWVKRNPMPQMRGVRFCNAHETLMWVQPYKRPYTFNYQAMKTLNGGKQMRSDWWLPEETADVWEESICQGKERLKGADGKKAHSTQKPERLLERIILACSNPGDVVLDPFFGTGTSGAVAKRLGRNWLGIEKEPQYVRLAEARIEGVVAP